MSKSLIVLLLVPLGLVTAQEMKLVALPTPQTSGGKPLFQALKERKSVRDFGPDRLSQQTLSNLLWAAWGINRDDGRRTAPSASNHQEIDVYVITAEGASVYDAKAIALKPVVRTDIRKLAGTQSFVADAPVNLVYVADTTKLGGDDAVKLVMPTPTPGSSPRTCICSALPKDSARWCAASVDRAALGKALNLRAEQRIILAQSVGYARKSAAN